jgi:hypothetical protein
MSVDYFETTVRQTFPADCLTPIERWLLTRMLETEETGDSLVFGGGWLLGDPMSGYGVSPDDKLTEALTASREICPELCAEVERTINKSEEFQGTIDYQRIFQSIVRRHPRVLHHVSIEDFYCNTKGGVLRETLTIITAQSIMSINSDGRINQRPWDPPLRYIENTKIVSLDVIADVTETCPF